MCIEIEDFCIKNNDFCIKNDDFCRFVELIKDVVDNKHLLADAAVVKESLAIRSAFNGTNPDFLSKNPDLLSRNSDFLLTNVDFYNKKQRRAEVCGWPEHGIVAAGNDFVTIWQDEVPAMGYHPNVAHNQGQFSMEES